MAIESGPEGTRTPDLYSAIVALSQLSYRPAAREYNSAAPTRASLRFDLQPPLGVCNFHSTQVRMHWVLNPRPRANLCYSASYEWQNEALARQIHHRPDGQYRRGEELRFRFAR